MNKEFNNANYTDKIGMIADKLKNTNFTLFDGDARVAQKTIMPMFESINDAANAYAKYCVNIEAGKHMWEPGREYVENAAFCSDRMVREMQTSVENVRKLNDICKNLDLGEFMPAKPLAVDFSGNPGETVHLNFDYKEVREFAAKAEEFRSEMIESVDTDMNQNQATKNSRFEERMSRIENKFGDILENEQQGEQLSELEA